MNKMLKIRGISKSFQNNTILNGVDIDVYPGEIVGLLGKNGAGKTTLIKSVMQLLTYGGDIYVDEIKLTQNNIKESISFLLEPAFLENLTALDNLKLLYGMTRRVELDKINKYLDIVALNDSCHQKVKDFSYGKKQRLGLAQALMEDSNYLILDEPTVGIDPLGLEILEVQLHDLSKKYNKGILFSSHELGFLEKVCDRIVLLENGVITKDIMLSSLHDRYVILLQGSYHDIVKELETLFELEVELNSHQSRVITPSFQLNQLLETLINNKVIIEKIEFVDKLSDVFSEEKVGPK